MTIFQVQSVWQSPKRIVWYVVAETSLEACQKLLDADKVKFKDLTLDDLCAREFGDIVELDF